MNDVCRIAATRNTQLGAEGGDGGEGRWRARIGHRWLPPAVQWDLKGCSDDMPPVGGGYDQRVPPLKDKGRAEIWGRGDGGKAAAEATGEDGMPAARATGGEGMAPDEVLPKTGVTIAVDTAGPTSAVARRSPRGHPQLPP